MKDKTVQEDIYMKVEQAFAFNWIRLRQKHGLSIYELSQCAGIDFTEVCSLENRLNIKLSVEDCKKIAGYYGMTYEEFLHEMTKSISMEGIVPNKDITTADLSDVYPYNLLMIAYGEVPDPAEVSLAGLKEMLELLSDSERLVIELRYRCGLSIGDITKETGMSREKVRRKEASVLKKMRYSGWREMLKNYTYADLMNVLEGNCGFEYINNNKLNINNE